MFRFSIVGLFAFDIATGANRTLATFSSSEIPPPLAYHPVTGVIGYAQLATGVNSLVKPAAGKLVPFVHDLPGIVETHCLAGSSASPLLYGTALVPDSKGGGVALFTVDLAKAAVIHTAALNFSLFEIAVSVPASEQQDLLRKADSRNNAS